MKGQGPLYMAGCRHALTLMSKLSKGQGHSVVKCVCGVGLHVGMTADCVQELDGVTAAAVIDSYKLDSATIAKRLWRLAVEHHAFFRPVDSSAI